MLQGFFVVFKPIYRFTLAPIYRFALAWSRGRETINQFALPGRQSKLP
jgi:hypothetical protein